MISSSYSSTILEATPPSLLFNILARFVIAFLLRRKLLLISKIGLFSGEGVISSVLSCCSKNSKWWTSVTILLQLSFIKQRIEHL